MVPLAFGFEEVLIVLAVAVLVEGARILFGFSSLAGGWARGNVKDDARALARAKVEEIAALPWEALDAYEKRIEEIKSPSGRLCRVESQTFWDMEEWASGMYIIVQVQVDTRWGWRPLSGWQEDTVLDPPEKPHSASPD